MIEALLDGANGPRRDIVLLNAGAALLVAGCARDLREGIALAARSLDEGGARRALSGLREVCGR
jgi:anthranilate phosphoribosyltransferase